MDFTQNHTINIESDAELLGDSSCQKEGGRAAADARHSVSLSADGNKESEPLFELDFENFLASLSKPSSSDRMAAPETTSPTHVDDKENQVPNSTRSSRRVLEALSVQVDLTEGTLGGGHEEDDPFQCLFPTQDMYAQRDRRSSQARRRSSGLDATKGTKLLKHKTAEAFRAFIKNCRNRKVAKDFKNNRKCFKINK